METAILNTQGMLMGDQGVVTLVVMEAHMEDTVDMELLISTITVPVDGIVDLGGVNNNSSQYNKHSILREKEKKLFNDQSMSHHLTRVPSSLHLHLK